MTTIYNLNVIKTAYFNNLTKQNLKKIYSKAYLKREISWTYLS